jgi:signal transduction histidine kinase
LYLLRRSDFDPSSKNLISIASDEIERVVRIVRQSLAYHSVDVTAREVDLATLIQESLQVFSDKFLHAGIAVRTAITPGITVMGFPDEIRQVIDNLLINAVEATPRGRVTLSLRQSHNWKNSRESGARLTIADEGCGIPTVDLPRLFDPFFTTKAAKGNGLGLWVVKGIVEKHGGSIKIRSDNTPTKSGTVVSIFLPRSSPMGKRKRSEYAA